MPRPRVLSFMSQWGGAFPRTPTSSTPNSPTLPSKPDSPTPDRNADSPLNASPGPPPPITANKPRHGHSRSSSMAMTYQPPVIQTTQDTPPELAPIFSYLNSHSNKLYQEGYFLKLHDLDARGRPSADRVWNECFAQLVGTVLSLWDAAQLDEAGENGDVTPTFINLTDASIKMIESLPMDGVEAQSLQNVLSVSTAANNRYLLHFNSLHSLTQWTAGIRLAMYEQTSLQEAYTGSIIAGKGKYLNNIRTIMERSRFPTEDWVRVRFGAGTPWRRCWCVVTPPDEKELSKAIKAAKKRSAYEKPPTLKGDLKFYGSRKINKKTQPVATVKDAYAAYSIYPSAKELIDQSTLIKVEGKITVHSKPEVTTEGFVFLMPEVHPAVTGFEIMLRFLLPIFDTFALYGRPTRLTADLADTRSLMFAMPNDRKYGYLDLIDVAGLIHTDGSQNWSEYDWRKQLKQLTAKRMSAPKNHSYTTSREQNDGSPQDAGTPSKSSMNGSGRARGVRYSEDEIRSAPSSRQGSPSAKGSMYSGQHSRNTSDLVVSTQRRPNPHRRSSSDAYRPQTSSRLSFESSRPPQNTPASPLPPPHTPASQTPQGVQGPPPPVHGTPVGEPQRQSPPPSTIYGDPISYSSHEQHNISSQPPPPPPPHGRASSYLPYNPNQGAYLGRDQFPPVQGYDEYYHADNPGNNNSEIQIMTDPPSPPPPSPPSPPNINRPFARVIAPPSFTHKSNAAPPFRPNQMPELRRASSAIDVATFEQLKDANPGGIDRTTKFGPLLRSQDDSQVFGGPKLHHAPPPVTRGRNLMASDLPERRLAPIPGTPAIEKEYYDVETREAGDLTRDKTIHRKPVPSRSPATSRSPRPRESPEQ